MPKTNDPRQMNAYLAADGDFWIWAGYTDEASAAADLDAVQAAHPGKTYRVFTDFDAWTAGITAQMLTPAREITAEHFHDMLNVLPPLQWENRGGIERFCMSEFTHLNVTNQFARTGGRYLCKPVEFNKRDTYISAADFDALPAQMVEA